MTEEAITAVSQESPNSDPMATFGPNEWLVDELYEQYKKDRNSVDKAWWSFFEDYTPGEGGSDANGASTPPRNGTAPAPAPAPAQSPSPAPAQPAKPELRPAA